MTTCPQCGGEAHKAIYFGLPLGVCADPTCSMAWGLGSYAMLVWFNGWLMIYTGSYWRALWGWLTRKQVTDGDR
jgi:hypothetical protein